MDQSPRIQDAEGQKASKPADTTATRWPAVCLPWRTTPPSGQESLDYAQLEEDTHQTTAEAERAAALHLDPWLPRISNAGQLDLKVRTRWLLQDIKQSMKGARTMADFIFEHQV